MALFKISKGNSANLPTEMHDGYCYFTIDDGKFYIDYIDTNDNDTLKRRPIAGVSVEYIEGTQTASTNAWTGVTRDNSLYKGKIIAYKLPKAGTDSAATLNLTLSNGTTSGAKTIKRQGASSTTTHYPAGTVIFMAYDGTYWQVNADYDSNSDKSVTQSASTSTDWRKVLLHYTANAEGGAVPAEVTNKVYAAEGIEVQPSTGTLKATKFKGPLEGNADTATEFSSNANVTLTGDVSGSANSTKGWNVTTTLATTGVTAGSYGPSENATPAYGATFNVPYITVDAKGRISAASTKTVKIPASDNTDTKNTAGSTDTSDKIFLIGAKTQATNPQTYSDNEVFVTDGTLSTKNIIVSGTATLSGETSADSLTAGNLQVNGSANFVNAPTIDSLTASQSVVTDANKKLVSKDLTVSSATAETSTATTFVYSVTSDATGKITVKTRPLPTYNNYSLPLAANGTRGGIQIGYSESGTNYAVKLSSEKAYVTVPWTDTKVTAVGNHYAPSADTNAALSASASGATAAWSIDVVKAVQLQRDAKGHVTGVTVTSGKIPANPNTDYKVRQTNDASTDANYRLLLSNAANDTQEDQISRKNANLIYNPSTNKLSTGNIKLTGELDVTGNAYLRNQTTADSLTAGSLIVNGSSTFNNDINLAQGAVKWTSNSLPSTTSADYFLVIDAFASGGATKYITKTNAIKTMVGSSAIGSSTKPIYWTGSAFSEITSYSGEAALTGTPTAPTAAAGTNTTQIATTEFVMNAFTANDAMVFKGVVNSASGLPATHYQGWTYKVGTAGSYVGTYCEIGDLIICVTDGTSANNAHWAVIQNNVDGAVFMGHGGSAIGGLTQPVYVKANGEVTAGTALKALAYKDSISYTPAGTISDTSITPAGTISSTSITPAGTNAKSAVTIKATTTDVYSMTSTGSVTAGTAASLSMSVVDEVLSFSWTTNTPTAVTLPGRSSAIKAWTGYTTGVDNTYAAAQVFTGTAASHNHTFTGTAASHNHTFTGTAATLS